MGRVREAQRPALTLAVVAAAAAAGCAGPSGLLSKQSSDAAMIEQYQKAVGKNRPLSGGDEVIAAPQPQTLSAAPAVHFACAWQPRPNQLPDPGRGGAMTPGLVGQVFLYTADMKPVDPKGDLTVTVSDATDRPPGMPPLKPEVYIYTADVLKKMAVDDERFGRSLAVFLPWPETWRDVSRLTMQARYDQPSGTLFSQPTPLTLDFSSPAGSPWTNQTRTTGVPDPRQAIQQAKFGPAGAGGVVNAGGFQPQTGGVVNAGGFPQSPMTLGGWPQGQTARTWVEPPPQANRPIQPNVPMPQGDAGGTRIVIPRPVN